MDRRELHARSQASLHRLLRRWRRLDRQLSLPLHEKIRSTWNLDALAPQMPEVFTLDDMGTINTALADEFPNDRLGTTYFCRDYNSHCTTLFNFVDSDVEAKDMTLAR